MTLRAYIQSEHALIVTKVSKSRYANWTAGDFFLYLVGFFSILWDFFEFSLNVNQRISAHLMLFVGFFIQQSIELILNSERNRAPKPSDSYYNEADSLFRAHFIKEQSCTRAFYSAIIILHYRTVFVGALFSCVTQKLTDEHECRRLSYYSLWYHRAMVEDSSNRNATDSLDG